MASETILKIFTSFPVLALGFYILMIITIFLYDLWSKWKYGELKNDSKARRILLCFSVRQNALLLITNNTEKEHFQCFEGIRVISTCAVVLIHQLTVIDINVELRGLAQMYSSPSQFEVVIMKCLLLSVDNFFFLSGFLVAYINLQRNTKSWWNWIISIIHRYIRLTPPLMVVISIYIFIFPYIENNPYWIFSQSTWIKECHGTWWYYLLYVNNFLSNAGCMNWLWYLACDMQLYFISPIFIIALKKNTKLGIALLIIATVISCVISGIISYVNTLDPVTVVAHDYSRKNFEVYNARKLLLLNSIYYPTYCRAGPYFIGMILGSVISSIKKEGIHIEIKNPWLITGWATTGVVILMLMSGLYFHHTSRVVNALINALFHSSWTLLMGWIVLMCLSGNGGLLNIFLSLPIWTIPSRLTYTCYLSHYLIVCAFYYNLSSNMPVSKQFFVIGYAGSLVLSYMFSFVLSVSTEIPFRRIDGIILNKK